MISKTKLNMLKKILACRLSIFSFALIFFIILIALANVSATTYIETIGHNGLIDTKITIKINNEPYILCINTEPYNETQWISLASKLFDIGQANTYRMIKIYQDNKSHAIVIEMVTQNGKQIKKTILCQLSNKSLYYWHPSNFSIVLSNIHYIYANIPNNVNVLGDLTLIGTDLLNNTAELHIYTIVTPPYIMKSTFLLLTLYSIISALYTASSRKCYISNTNTISNLITCNSIIKTMIATVFILFTSFYLLISVALFLRDTVAYIVLQSLINMTGSFLTALILLTITLTHFINIVKEQLNHYNIKIYRRSVLHINLSTLAIIVLVSLSILVFLIAILLAYGFLLLLGISNITSYVLSLYIAYPNRVSITMILPLLPLIPKAYLSIMGISGSKNRLKFHTLSILTIYVLLVLAIVTLFGLYVLNFTIYVFVGSACLVILSIFILFIIIFKLDTVSPNEIKILTSIVSIIPLVISVLVRTQPITVHTEIILIGFYSYSIFYTYWLAKIIHYQT